MKKTSETSHFIIMVYVLLTNEQDILCVCYIAAIGQIKVKQRLYDLGVNEVQHYNRKELANFYANINSLKKK